VISGTCKRETGAQHANLIKTILTATENQKKCGGVLYRTVSIASDGESKRGQALVRLTMNTTLKADSPIYEQLCPLRFMNYLVGSDDITADKDFKHVFKRQRNLMMRNKGILIQGFCITPPILRAHLQSNGVSSFRLRALLNPNDKQDVVLGYSLLKEIWSLPAASSGSDPSFSRARKALRVYGRFAQNLIMPYICVDLNLDEQLIHLSAATHLALYLYNDNSARTKFMPTQSYVDIMLMVKNIYFCVAKVKVDNPQGTFYIIQLGTDRLEQFFGLVRTAVGTDTNVDTVQLGNRASGLTEVAIILAQHPEWDRGPRRLQLPAITKDSGDISMKADHINPASWRGKLDVASVNLHTCWVLGRQRAVELVPEAADALDRLSSTPGIDILSPLGDILVNVQDADDEFDCSELSSTHGTQPTELTTVEAPTRVSQPFTPDGDMEDAIAEEAPRNNKIVSEIIINGQKTTKAKALRHRMMFQTSRSSTDRLKRVQELPCFNCIPTPELDTNIILHDSSFGAPSLRIGNPIASLVQCENLIFLAIAEVNRLHFAGKNNLDEIGLHLLADGTAKVDFQILRLRPATEEDDPSQQYDWCWSLQMESTCDNVPGRFIHPLNPPVSVRMPGKPTFLFDSSFLVTISSSLFQELSPHDLRSVPVVKRSPSFPYRNDDGKACFICEHDDATHPPLNESSSDCSGCGPKVKLDRSNAQRVLEHMGAHILYDTTIDGEACGLCLRPSPMCRLVLKKGRGADASYSLDLKKSTCANLMRFQYTSAEQSSKSSPCSNVPIICPLCPAQNPAVWTYNLHIHFREQHKIVSPLQYPVKVQLSECEREAMKKIWDTRFKFDTMTRKHRNLKNKKDVPMRISEAHSSRLALRR
jgi:hypothetical protein